MLYDANYLSFIATQSNRSFVILTFEICRALSQKASFTDSSRCYTTFSQWRWQCRGNTFVHLKRRAIRFALPQIISRNGIDNIEESYHITWIADKVHRANRHMPRAMISCRDKSSYCVFKRRLRLKAHVMFTCRTCRSTTIHVKWITKREELHYHVRIRYNTSITFRIKTVI